MDPAKIELIKTIFPMIALISVLAIGGWIVTTWLRIKNGYPLDGQWGQALHPTRDPEAERRIVALTSDNAALRGDLQAIKQRLATVESIVTDDGVRLSKEIDRLDMTRN